MRRLLRRLLSDADRRSIESDLAELFEVRRRRDGDRAAARWLARQRLLYPFHLFADRLRGGIADWIAGLRGLGRDVPYSVRSLARAPALAATILLTVGVGLGSTTAMLSVVRAVLISPLPYAEPESLVWIYTDNPPFRFRFSVVDYRALEADHPAFSNVAAYQTQLVTITAGDRSERVVAKAVSGSYFPLLRQRPIVGRLFDPSDDRRDDPLAVVTHGFWQRHFGGDPAVPGATIALDGVVHTIVGVLQPPEGPLESSVAVFTAARWPVPKRKGPFFIMALGRLRADVPRAEALHTLRATNARLFPIWRSSYQDEKATWGMQDLKERVVGETGARLLLGLAAVACVLLIAWVNTVNLLIARALNRSRELAIRGALGASRGRLVQHLLAEAGVLAAGAAVVGLSVAAGAVRLIATYGGAYIPRIDEVALSGVVLGWLAGLALLSCLVIGLVPAIQTSRLRLQSALTSGGRSATDGPAARRLRRALVAVEFALATPLLVAAALVTASLDRLNRVDVGIDTARVLTAGVSLPGARYAENADRRAFWDRALARLAALPGVEAAALADSRPPHEGYNLNNFNLEDRPTPPGENQPICPWIAASPDFFKAVGLPLERGRLFDTRDLAGGPPVVIVDRAWASRFFPGAEVLGRRFQEGGCTTCPWITVVGVVGTVKFSGLESPDQGTVYYPFAGLPNGYLVLRAADPATLVAPVRQAVRQLDQSLPLTDIATGEELVSNSLATSRHLSVLVGMFALTAVALSLVGIYGVMVYFVQQHTRDIGIRLALGGEPSAMRRIVVAQGLRLVVVGVGLGVATAFFTGRLMRTMLFGISPTDPWMMAAVSLALVGVAAVACLAPARRAARLDPVTILREG
ncbi:MAG TPA: ABC transporter permease [Vicinamibacterales bacterium]|nr:ABC transporter permease [Vicinamibacterales bacterium]